MKSGQETYDQPLLDSLEKRYQLFLDSPNGEINVYLILSKNDDSKSETSNKSYFNNNHTEFNPNQQNFNNINNTNNILRPNKSSKNITKGF